LDFSYDKFTFFICETTGPVVVTVDVLGILYAAKEKILTKKPIKKERN
jgi:hypothetical protein